LPGSSRPAGNVLQAAGARYLGDSSPISPRAGEKGSREGSAGKPFLNDEFGSTRAPSLAGLANTQSTMTRGTAAVSATQADFFKGPTGAGMSHAELFPRQSGTSELAPLHSPTSPQGGAFGLERPDTPIRAYVDRSAFPGLFGRDEFDESLQTSSQVREIQLRDPNLRGNANTVTSTAESRQVANSSSLDDWEAELLEWKRQYGCPDVPDDDHAVDQQLLGMSAHAETMPSASSTAGAAAVGLLPTHRLEENAFSLHGMTDFTAPTSPQTKQSHEFQVGGARASASESSGYAPWDTRANNAIGPSEVLPSTRPDPTRNLVQNMPPLPKEQVRNVSFGSQDREMKDITGDMSLHSHMAESEMGRGSSRIEALLQQQRPSGDVSSSSPLVSGEITAEDIRNNSMADQAAAEAPLESSRSLRSQLRGTMMLSSYTGLPDDSHSPIENKMESQTSPVAQVMESMASPPRAGLRGTLMMASVAESEGDSKSPEEETLKSLGLSTDREQTKPASPRGVTFNTDPSVQAENILLSQKVGSLSRSLNGELPQSYPVLGNLTAPNFTSFGSSPSNQKGEQRLAESIPPVLPTTSPKSNFNDSLSTSLTIPLSSRVRRPSREGFVPRPPSRQADEQTALERPASAGRRFVYTREDLEVASNSARARLKPDGTWKSGYSEAGLQKRDFFLDIRKQRAKDKGRQATGPLWIHLAAQAKNLASSFDLSELLEAFKMFCSVRYDDYELYMRILGEVPHYVKDASADQLCELIRLLARRRLRERNYVDMVAAHLLQKIRITDDNLPARLLVKTANAFAAVECRSQPKFVEHFLRHMEHRIEELDAPLCCMVTPVFIAHYMSDALRRAFLKRCAETQAGFHGALYELRNMACSELLLRKEHHSFLVSLPAYVGRYLEKVRHHAHFDKWGSVTLPVAAAPNGPKGAEQADVSLSLQRKASTATGGQKGDVFSSDMHRDVSACLTHLGIEHENGVLCGPYLLDIVALDMVNPSKRIVYEVNSPHHYYEGTQALTADKRLRHRLLGRLGQKLHMVYATDWRPLSAAQKMTHMLKLQQAQQEENSKDAKQQAAANTMRAPLSAMSRDGTKKPGPLRLKSIRDVNAPIRVPVPPSLRANQPLTARDF